MNVALRRPDNRLVGLDILRTASIVLVLANHAIVRLSPSGGRSLVGKIATGHYGVCIFFVISGFIITETLMRREPDVTRLSRRDFYARRVGRLAPLALVVLVLAALLALLLPSSEARAFIVRDPRAHFSWSFFVSFPGLFFNWVRVAHSNHSPGWGVSWDVFWSLAIEEQFYLIYPAVMRRLGAGRRLVIVLALTVICGTGFSWWAATAYPRNVALTLYSSFPGFALLAIGCLVALALHQRPDWPASVPAALLTVAGGGVIAFVFRATDITQHSFDRVWGPFVIGIGAAIAIVGLRRLPDNPLWRLLGRPGELCYGLYLLHGTVLLVLWSTLPRPPALIGFALFCGVSFAIASVSYRFFEVPLNRRIRTALAPPRQRT